MRKHLLLLPLIGGLLLSGCQKNVKDSDLPINTLREFEGYKLATSVKDGKKYLLGDYRHREDLIRFANGDYHKDDKGEYPFYMATVAGTTDGAAEFLLKYTNKKKGEFSLQCFTSDPDLPWNGKYVGCYAGTSTQGNKVTSLALLDDPKETSYIDDKGNECPASGIFKFYETVDDLAAYAPGIPFQYPGLDADAANEPKFLGSSMKTEEEWDQTHEDFISMDCKRWEEALGESKYNLAHLYEKA